MNQSHYYTIINQKTGLIFGYKNINNYYIYNYDNYLIVFNILSNMWSLLISNTNNIAIESNNLNDVIYKFLYDTNRLAIVIYSNNNVDEITNMLLNCTI